MYKTRLLKLKTYKYFKGMVSLLNHIFKMCITVVSFYNLYTRK